MDDQLNQSASVGGPIPPPPSPGVGVSPPPPASAPPPSGAGPVGGLGGENPHAQVMAALSRIEAKLAEISAKLGV